MTVEGKLELKITNMRVISLTCLSFNLSICPRAISAFFDFFWPFIILSICLLFHLSVCLSICLFLHFSICTYAHFSIWVFIYFSLCLFENFSIYLFVNLSVYSFVSDSSKLLMFCIWGRKQSCNDANGEKSKKNKPRATNFAITSHPHANLWQSNYWKEFTKKRL